MKIVFQEDNTCKFMAEMIVTPTKFYSWATEKGIVLLQGGLEIKYFAESSLEME